jgi:putative salt-induced outer membrane protein YdiY
MLSGMPVSRRWFVAGWVVCVLWAAVLALAALPLRAADDRLPERLTLDTGDELLGYSLGVVDGELLWQPDEGQPVRIPLDLVSHVEIAPETAALADNVIGDLPPSPAATLTEPEQLATREESPWIETVPLINVVPKTYHFVMGSANIWTQRINVGGQFIDGNAQTDLVNVMVNFENGTPREMRQIDLIGQWGRNQGRQTANKWILNGNFDWPLDADNKWISYFTNKNEYDELANLDYRGTFGTGIGYRFLNESKRRLITRVGPAYTIEIFRKPADHRESPDLFAEIEVRWGLFHRTSFETKTRVQPSMMDIELVRVFSTSGLMVDLDDEDRWKLRLGMQYTYNSQPNPGRVPSDYTTTVSLVYTRK